MSFKILICLKTSISFENLEICDLIDLTLELYFLHFMTSKFIFNLRSRRFSWFFLEGHRTTPCQLDHFKAMLFQLSFALSSFLIQLFSYYF